jgi:hydroxymethylglutaryl-CoA reductase
MNGIDAVALATGNDWRAIEAGAHAYAARGGRYTSLTPGRRPTTATCSASWRFRSRSVLLVAPADQPDRGPEPALLGVESARELAEVMGAVGLAQTFSALRALVTEGIQQGHMTLHARSVATAAGVPPELFDTVVERLIASGEIKIWKAEEIMRRGARAKRTGQARVEATAEEKPWKAKPGRRPRQDHPARRACGGLRPPRHCRAHPAGHPGPGRGHPRRHRADHSALGHRAAPGFHGQAAAIIRPSMARLLARRWAWKDRGMRIEVFPNVPAGHGPGRFGGAGRGRDSRHEPAFQAGPGATSASMNWPSNARRSPTARRRVWTTPWRPTVSSCLFRSGDRPMRETSRSTSRCRS